MDTIYKNLNKILVLVFLLKAIPYGTTFDTISGELPSKVIDKGHPYLVIADIEVAPGNNVTIEPGVVFLFKNFTGLQVHGILLVKGTKDKPVIFTSENNQKYVPTSPMEAAPYDWNGITVHENASGTTLDWATIEYSLFGINSLTNYINIRNCYFKENGKTDLTISGEIIKPDQQPFTVAFSIVDSTGLRIAPEIKESFGLRASRQSLRYVGLTTAISTGALAYLKWKDFKKSDAAYKKYLKEYNYYIKIDSLERGMSDRFTDANKKRKDDFSMIILNSILSFIGLSGFTVSFFF